MYKFQYINFSKFINFVKVILQNFLIEISNSFFAFLFYYTSILINNGFELLNLTTSKPRSKPEFFQIFRKPRKLLKPDCSLKDPVYTLCLEKYVYSVHTNGVSLNFFLGAYVILPQFCCKFMCQKF